MKKILFGIILFTIITVTPCAADSQTVTLLTPTDISVLKSSVNKDGLWEEYQLNSIISAGDEVVFQIHAYGNGGEIINLKSYLDNINNTILSQGQSITVGAKLSADNASEQSGSVRITANNKVKLVYKKYRWVKTTWAGQEPIYQTKDLTLPDSQDGIGIMNRGGVRQGSLEKSQNSNLLIYFYVKSAD